MTDLITEIYQFLFISSIVFIINILIDLIVKTYGRFKLKKETRILLTKTEKIILWISIAIFFSYIIN
jgi:hypothetical protein